MFLEIITRNLKQIIIIQLLLIIVLIGVVYRNIKQVNIIPIKSHNISFNQVDSLEYYYEPVNYPFDEPLPWDSDIKVVYTMNKDTIRANKEYTIPKPPDTLRIVAIGDSFTFGQFVKDDETYPAQLEVLLKEKLKGKYNNVEVINLGVPGYDIEYAIARYYKRAYKYDPNYILWLLSNDDFPQRNEVELKLIDKLKKTMTKEEVEDYKKKGIYYPYHEIARESIRRPHSLNSFINYNLNLIELFTKKQNHKLIFAIPQNSDSITLNKIKYFSSNNNGYIIYLTNIYRRIDTHFPDSHPNKLGYSIYVNDLINAKLIN